MNWLHRTLKISGKKKDSKNPGFLSNIEKDTVENDDFRRVLFTTKNSQLVLMSVAPEDEIGEEVHDLDQFIRFESGEGYVTLGNFKQNVTDGDAIVVPQGVSHNVVNTSKTKPLKLYAVYSPPNHKKGTVHHTKADAKEEHFDGKTDLTKSAGLFDGEDSLIKGTCGRVQTLAQEAREPGQLEPLQREIEGILGRVSSCSCCRQVLQFIQQRKMQLISKPMVEPFRR